MPQLMSGMWLTSGLSGQSKLLPCGIQPTLMSVDLECTPGRERAVEADIWGKPVNAHRQPDAVCEGAG